MKHIVITGTSKGIGNELVKHFAQNGHQILSLSRSTPEFSPNISKHITHLSADITEDNAITKVNEFITQNWNSTVDVLINNAGQLYNKPFLETTSTMFQKSYEVNVFGPVKLMQTLIPFMSTESHIVNISSMGGIQGSVKFPGLSAYSSSKGALITLTELLAEEFKDSGPAINALALGAVQTEMLEAAFPGFEAPVSASEMAQYIANFALQGQKFYNGKILQVSSTTP